MSPRFLIATKLFRILLCSIGIAGWLAAFILTGFVAASHHQIIRPLRSPDAPGSVLAVADAHPSLDCGAVPRSVIPGHVIARRRPDSPYRLYGAMGTSAALSQVFTPGATKVYDSIAEFCR